MWLDIKTEWTREHKKKSGFLAGMTRHIMVQFTETKKKKKREETEKQKKEQAYGGKLVT